MTFAPFSFSTISLSTLDKPTHVSSTLSFTRIDNKGNLRPFSLTAFSPTVWTDLLIHQSLVCSVVFPHQVARALLCLPPSFKASSLSYSPLSPLLFSLFSLFFLSTPQTEHHAVPRQSLSALPNRHYRTRPRISGHTRVHSSFDMAFFTTEYCCLVSRRLDYYRQFLHRHQRPDMAPR